MKRISFAALLLLITSTVTFAQRIMKVEKTDGTIVEYPLTEVARVYFEEIVHPDLTLSTNTLSLKVGDLATVEIMAGSGNYTVVSDRPSMAIAELNGTVITVTAVAVGTAIIAVTDNQSNQTVTIAVTVTAAENPTTDAVAVDLGLPSGTKWADRNVGASSPEDYGGYFAWGETQTKSVYNWNTYQYRSSENNVVNIGTDIAGTDYDVAHVKWGGSWKMPTWDQVKELLDNCTHEWTSVNGINGRRFTSKINGNSIFLPAAGYRWDSALDCAGSRGYFWSSTLYESGPDFAYYLLFDSRYAYGDIIYRGNGQSVRPVISGTITPDLALSAITLSLKVGEPSTIEITAGSGSYAVVSDQPSVATAELEGSTITVAGVAVGTAAITVTDTQSGQTATIAVTVTAAENPTTDAVAVDLGLPSGTKWADRNVGASSPEDYGGYFAWGETQTKSVYNWDTYQYGSSENNVVNIGTDIAGTDYDVAHVKWGGSWKMPTRDQVRELFENCTHEWTTVNGINGRRFTSKINGNSIFLPAAGYCWDSNLNLAGSNGEYWSSTLNESYPDYADGRYFDSSGAGWFYGSRYYGQSVRPVR